MEDVLWRKCHPSIKKSDAMLVSLIGDSIVSRTIPGKVQSYMAAGKPIIGAISGDAKIIVEEANCGYVSPERDVKQLAKKIFVNLVCYLLRDKES